MILILDTDHLTAIQRQAEPAYSNLHARLRAARNADVCATIISFEEQMRGWLSLISKATGPRQVFAYQRLHSLLSFFCSIPILDFDAAASEQLTILHRLRLRVGTMDLKISAIARSKEALLLSVNVRDFQRVPDLRSKIGLNEFRWFWHS